MAAISRLLATARREAGFTQRELAEVADVPQSSISRIERGLMSPRASTIERWLEACGRAFTLAPIVDIAPAPPRWTEPDEPQPASIDVDEHEEPSDWASWLS